tara:strand:+ start:380 stop:1084 length:705 start_codon:yes stop_codon:yes gene_type:complete
LDHLFSNKIRGETAEPEKLMSSAIWLITYQLQHDREGDYVAWFHDIHMPEKLARPGYTWAAHYRTPSAEESDTGARYVALFGGESSAVFYNPSPAQLALTQPPETRDMMGCRIDSRSLILSGEWAINGSDVIESDCSPVESNSIGLTLCDTGGNDMDFSAWLLQEHVPSLNGCGISKFLTSSGDARHTIIHTPEADAALPPFADPTGEEWEARVADYITYPLGHPLIDMDRISP